MRPFVVGIIYILLIPIFASIYAYIWEDFYQSTANLERATKEINEGSKKALREILGPWLSSYSARGFNFLSFEVEDPIVKEGQVTVCSPITFRFPGVQKEVKSMEEYHSLKFRKDTDVDTSDGIFSPKITLKPVWSISLRDGAFQMGPMPEFFDSKMADHLRAFSRLQIHVKGDGVNYYADERFVTGQIDLPKRTKALLRRLELASEGFPGPGGGGFSRYVYFSTVIITTLGFGDIVPMTDRARLLVALEAILGIVLMGLFLNSVAVKIAGQRENDPETGAT
jgi:hypothetical protein